MSDIRELLEQERRRFALGGDPFRDLERRRDRKRRNRRIASGLVALIVAAAGIGASLYAFRPSGSGKPAHSPTPSGPSITTPGPSPSGTTPSPVSPGGGLAAPAVSGPIEFVDDQHGWMVDAGGQILATADGGHTWKVQLSGPSNVTAIDMFDGRYGWGVGDGGLVRTTDGGAHWDTWGNQPLATIQFVTPEVGWGVEATGGAEGRLMKSEDAGRTWKEQGLTVGSVCAVDPNVAWAAGGGEGGVSLQRTSDGGASWVDSQPIASSEPWTSFEVRCTADGREAFLLLTGGGAAGHVSYVAFQETSSGATIEHHAVLVASFAAAVLGVDAYHDDDPYPGVFAVIGPGTAYFVNWCPACDSPSASFVKSEGEPSAVTDRIPIQVGRGPAQPLGISFVDQDHGWILLNDMQAHSLVVLRTSDGGKTWAQP